MQFYEYDTTPSKGKEPVSNTGASSFQPLSLPKKSTMTRPRVSEDTFDIPQNALMPSQTARDAGNHKTRTRRSCRGSNTWSSSNTDIKLTSEEEEVTDPAPFVFEYNRLARKYGIRLLVLGDFPLNAEKTTQSLPSRKGSWITRMLHQGSSVQPKQAISDKTDQALRHRRSISDLALNFVYNQRKEGLKNEDLRGLVRLCGKSILYLPSEYTFASLVLPTCLRATAQYLIQHANTSGIFRVSGSVRVINALYDYYCADGDGEDISTTTRCPNLPSHLNCGVHDVASTFKRLLAGLPGGILGSLTLFDALVAVHSQLHSYAETNRTKESKLRARLIALAISTVKSQYQRDLICAVFGLLCLVGRAAENAPREDDYGRPLPTSDLMGYNSLAIIFGPLLIGDLLNSYSMKLADPASGLIILPLTPCKSGRHRKLKKAKQKKPTMLTVDRVLVANEITEMLLVHWRDIVRHLTNLYGQKERNGEARSSLLDATSIQGPSNWKMKVPLGQFRERISSPDSASPTPSPRIGSSEPHSSGKSHDDLLSIKRQRPRTSRLPSVRRMSRRHSLSALPPTVEESPGDHWVQERGQTLQEMSFTPASYEPGKEHQTKVASPAINATLSASGGQFGQNSELKVVRNSRKCTSQLEDAPELLTDNTKHGLLHMQVGTIAGRIRQESSSSQGTTRRVPPSDITSNMDHDEIPSLSFSEKSTAGHTPLRYDGNILPQISTPSQHLVLSTDDAQPSSILPGSGTQTPMMHGVERSDVLHLSENQVLPHNMNIGLQICSESALPPSCGVEKSPSYHPSVLDPLRTPPKYTPEYAQVGKTSDKSRGTSLPGHLPATETSSMWSLQHLVTKKSPYSPSDLEASFPQAGEGQYSTCVRRHSAARRWRDLVQNSPISPSEDIKEKRMTRFSEHSSTAQISESTPNTPERPPTPEWKRQLLKKKMGDKRQATKLSPKRKSVLEKSDGKEPLRDFSVSFKEKGICPKDLPTNTSGSPSRRSTSKPVSGTVRSIAARFDNVSQESTPTQEPSLHGRSQINLRSSRSFLSQDDTVESPNEPTKTPEAPKLTHIPTKSLENSRSAIPSKTGNPSGRFRASISRLSHSLRPSPARTKNEGTPSRPANAKIQPPQGFIVARNEPQIIYSGLPHRILETDRLPSPSRLSNPQAGPSVTQRLVLAHQASENSSRNRMTPRARDEISVSEDHSSRPDNDSSNSLLYRQIRSLTNQLEYKTEEVEGLRRQMDDSYITDSGTLSGQLRQANQDCKIWRERAEAAEKRIAVFERFISRLRGLRGSVDDGANLVDYDIGLGESSDKGKYGSLCSSSSCSNHTENQEVFKNRIRSSFTEKNARTGGGDGPNSPNSPERDQDYEDECLEVREKKMSLSNISNATAELWIVANELLAAQEAMDK